MAPMRYVALLRGINVGGKSIVRMADLKECVEALGHAATMSFGSTSPSSAGPATDASSPVSSRRVTALTRSWRRRPPSSGRPGATR